MGSPRRWPAPGRTPPFTGRLPESSERAGEGLTKSMGRPVHSGHCWEPGDWGHRGGAQEKAGWPPGTFDCWCYSDENLQGFLKCSSGRAGPGICSGWGSEFYLFVDKTMKLLWMLFLCYSIFPLPSPLLLSPSPPPSSPPPSSPSTPPTPPLLPPSLHM